MKESFSGNFEKNEIFEETILDLKKLNESIFPGSREIIKINEFINFYRTENFFKDPEPKKEIIDISRNRKSEVIKSINNGPSLMIDMQGNKHINQVVNTIKKDKISYKIVPHSWGKELISKRNPQKKLYLVNYSKLNEFKSSVETESFGIVSFRGHNHEMQEKTIIDSLKNIKNIKILHLAGCNISKDVIEKSDSTILSRNSFLDHFQDEKNTKFVISNTKTGQSNVQTKLLLGLHAFMPNLSEEKNETNAYIQTNGNLVEYIEKAYETNKSFKDNGISLTIID